MADENKPAEIAPLPPEEAAVMYSGPAILANRVLLAMTSTGVRMTFVEQPAPDSEPKFRAAVIVPFVEAYDFADVLKKLLAPVEQQVLAIKAATATGNAPNA